MNPERLTETETGRECLFSGKILDLVRLGVALPDGQPAVREVVMHVGSCAVIPVNIRGEAALVWQYRAAAGKLLLEIPAGKLDAGEAPLACAERELLEETGLTAGKMMPLASFYATPGYSSEKIHVFLATKLKQGEARPDEGEYLSVVWIAMDELFAMAQRGEIEDAKTLIAILMARLVCSQ